MKKFRITVDVEYDHDVDPSEVGQRYVNAMMKEVGNDSQILEARINRRNAKRQPRPNRNQLGRFDHA